MSTRTSWFPRIADFPAGRNRKRVDPGAVSGYCDRMAVKSPKKSPVNKSGPKVVEKEVITLRIGPADKKKLIAHCAQRAKAENRQISYNKAILELIQGL